MHSGLSIYAAAAAFLHASHAMQRAMPPITLNIG